MLCFAKFLITDLSCKRLILMKILWSKPDVASQANLWIRYFSLAKTSVRQVYNPTRKTRRLSWFETDEFAPKTQKIVVGPAVTMLWTLSKPEITRPRSDGMTLPIAREDQKGCFPPNPQRLAAALLRACFVCLGESDYIIEKSLEMRKGNDLRSTSGPGFQMT